MKQLTELELNQVAGGNYEWEQIGVGIAMVGLGIALVSTAGLATIPVALAGAATMGEIGIGAAGIGLAGMGASPRVEASVAAQTAQTVQKKPESETEDE